MGRRKLTSAQGGSSLFKSQAGLDPGLSSLFSQNPRANDEDVRVPPLSQEQPRDDIYDSQNAASVHSFNGLHSGDFKNAQDELPIQLATQDPKAADELGPFFPKAKSAKKRKRKDDELEDLYLQRLEREEEREQDQMQEERNAERCKQDSENAELALPAIGATSPDVSEPENEVEGSLSPPPLHETSGPSKIETDLDKAARTVFLANVSIATITSKTSRKILLNHLASILPSLPQGEKSHRVESLRFRSTAFSGNVPKREAFAKKDIMEATTKSTNAYVVYSTRNAAREAARKLNGTVVLGRHLRVDEVAHPAEIDHRRCVFIGNLGFVDDESQIKAAQEAETGKKQSKAQNGDSEEGLWRQFGKAGTVESVRVVRDSKTRVGKGFAYVQFTDQNGVEAALLFNDKSFPPLLPRKLRVVRAKKPRRDAPKASVYKNRGRGSGKKDGVADPDLKSLQGRVGKLLGRSGRLEVKSAHRVSEKSDRPRAESKGIQRPESFVFEGYRASSKNDNQGIKFRNSNRKKAGKPQNRGAKRAAAWKAKGGNAKVR